MSEVLGLLLTRRWSTLTAVALVTIVGFGVLSHWQWDRAHRDQDEIAAATTAAADPAAVPVAGLLPVSGLDPANYGRRVTVTGEFLPTGQRLVQRGDAYYWVVTALAPPAGPLVPVVRGSVASPTAVPPPPTGPVTVAGRLEPYDGDPGAQPSDAGLPAGQVPRLAPSALQAALGAPVAGGWIAASDPTPGLTLVEAPNSPLADAGVHWQNATYAVQWVLFAGFVVFMWQRWFRDELAESRGEHGPGTSST